MAWDCQSNVSLDLSLSASLSSRLSVSLASCLSVLSSSFASLSLLSLSCRNHSLHSTALCCTHSLTHSLTHQGFAFPQPLPAQRPLDLAPHLSQREGDVDFRLVLRAQANRKEAIHRYLRCLELLILTSCMKRSNVEIMVLNRWNCLLQLFQGFGWRVGRGQQLEDFPEARRPEIARGPGTVSCIKSPSFEAQAAVS